MPTVNEAVATIQRRLGFLASGSLTDEIIEELVNSQHELEMDDEIAWFLLKFDETLQNDATDLEWITLPSDYIDVPEHENYFYLQDSDGNIESRLTREDFADIKDAQANENAGSRTGTPAHWDIVGQKIYLGPYYPSEQKTFSLLYYGADTDPAAGGAANLWLTHAPQVLINHAGFTMALTARDKDAIQVFDTLYKRAWDQFIKQNERRRNSGKDSAQRFVHRI